MNPHFHQALDYRPEPVMPLSTPCDECPWRTCNHGKRDSRGFYTKQNLTRLWNQLRRGGAPQSCHPTDPQHPDHGAPAGAKARECPGSVILIIREAERLKSHSPTGVIEPETCDAYFRTRPRGLTRNGILYWIVSRISLGGKPFIGGPVLPEVDYDDARISLPAYLED